MTITTYPDGHSVQQGTPEELAQFIFAATEVQTLQKFKSLVAVSYTHLTLPTIA